jgi:hypothetical protein
MTIWNTRFPGPLKGTCCPMACGSLACRVVVIVGRSNHSVLLFSWGDAARLKFMEHVAVTGFAPVSLQTAQNFHLKRPQWGLLETLLPTKGVQGRNECGSEAMGPFVPPKEARRRERSQSRCNAFLCSFNLKYQVIQ